MDPHQWRSAPPYFREICPPPPPPPLPYPFCPPPPPFDDTHFSPPYPYPFPPPPPPHGTSFPHPPVHPPVPHQVEGSRKRMRVDDPLDPCRSTNSNWVVSKDQNVLNLIKNHGGEDDFQYSNARSYQYHQNQQIYHHDHNNPYNDPANHSHGDGYYVYKHDHSHMDPNPYHGYSAPNRVDNGHGYRPDLLRPVSYPPPPINASGQLSSFGRVQNPLYLSQKEDQTSIYPSLSKPSIKDERESDSRKIKINACNLFKEPNRATRPDHFVIILRGLPGSGKSYLAKILRDIEIQNGGDAPRIHSMDDYFMIEVEKEENEGSNSKSRGKKMTKKVIEYCYEAEMEETYRSSMLKAFKKTLDEGKFTFIIVDDRNLRVADFAQFWAVAKRSGYEVYLLEAPYKDPMGCVARNVHGFTLDEIKKMETQWESAPSLYLQLDIEPLLRGDDLKEENIKEVEMDLEEDEFVQPTHNVHDNNTNTYTNSNITNSDNKPDTAEGSDYEDEEKLGLKDLGQSKWSRNNEEERENPEASRRNSNSLSCLMQTYHTSKKSVHWSDRADKGGFSIGSSAKKRTNLSLIIGPGSGYNLKSNPLIEENKNPKMRNKGHENLETKRQFSDQLRAESESFKAVFDQRKHHIGGLDNAENE